MTPLKELGAHGQSVWLDYIRRDLVEQGGLADLVAEGVRGITSNPSIFEKAIGGSTEYDAALDELLASTPTATPLSLFEAVAIEDIRNAADVLSTAESLSTEASDLRSKVERFFDGIRAA